MLRKYISREEKQRQLWIGILLLPPYVDTNIYLVYNWLHSGSELTTVTRVAEPSIRHEHGL